MPRPKQRTPELRAQLLDCALTLFEQDGPRAVTARAVAAAANSSVPAVYELFGDKQGLARALFFAGFRRLHARFETLEGDDGQGADARAELEATWWAIRSFAGDHPALAQLMFGRAFTEFDPGPQDLRAGDGTRRHIVGRVRRYLAPFDDAPSPTDAAHLLLATAQGLALQEQGGWLGQSEASRRRRWQLGLDCWLRGLVPDN